MSSLQQNTLFEEKELRVLVDMFKRALAADPASANSGTASVEALRDLPETAGYGLFQRALHMQNEDKSGRIRFTEFARAFSSFSPRMTLEEKLQFAFKVFDVDADGRIEEDELFASLRMCLGTAIPCDTLMAMVRKYLVGFPDGLTFPEFAKVIDVNDLHNLIFRGPG